MHILVSVPQGKKCTRKGKEVLLILISILELFLMQVHAIPPVQCTSHPLLAYRYLSKFFIIKRTCKQLYASCFIRIIQTSTNTAFFFQRYSFQFFFFCVWNTKYISYALVIFHKLGQQLLSIKSSLLCMCLKYYLHYRQTGRVVIVGVNITAQIKKQGTCSSFSAQGCCAEFRQKVEICQVGHYQ